MDPLSQGMLGAAAAHALLGRKLGAKAAWVGLGAGLAVDLDVLVPVFLEVDVEPQFHRHASHALIAILPGGVLSALPWMLFRSFRAKAGLVMLAGILGWATHGILDAATSYGTHLAWPFSLERSAFDVLPIIDPLFTLPLTLLVLFGVWRKGIRWSQIALLWCALYAGFGAYQHASASELQARLAASRGHTIERARVMPLPASLVMWRSLYEVDGRAYADWIRVLPGTTPKVRRGDSAALVRELPAVAESPRGEAAWGVFRRFADDWIVRRESAEGPLWLDVRFGVQVEIGGLWGMAAAPEREAGLRWSQGGTSMGSDNVQLALAAILRGEGMTELP